MKTYADVLINKVEGGHKWYKADPNMDIMHYEARHKNEDIFIMWMETKMMRKRCSLPCVLFEGGQPLVFQNNGFAGSKENSMLMKRWSLFVSPKNIDTDWEVRFLEKDEFLEKFKKAQSGELFAKQEEIDKLQETEEGTEE